MTALVVLLKLLLADADCRHRPWSAGDVSSCLLSKTAGVRERLLALSELSALLAEPTQRKDAVSVLAIAALDDDATVHAAAVKLLVREKVVSQALSANIPTLGQVVKKLTALVSEPEKRKSFSGLQCGVEVDGPEETLRLRCGGSRCGDRCLHFTSRVVVDVTAEWKLVDFESHARDDCSCGLCE